jgi:hypothetical protein
MTDRAAIASAAIAPMLADASARAEQVSQLVVGEVADLLDRRGEWRRVRAAFDRYEGWVHEGYLLEVDADRAAQWDAAATSWSLGAMARVERGVVRLPLRGRAVPRGEGIELPDGRWGAVFEGGVPARSHVLQEAQRLRPEAWAMLWFGGSHYQWGGVTPLGVDCSGLVQTTFAARGVALPRDAWQQASAGTEVAPDEAEAGDLLFFRGESGDRIAHVAICAGNDEIVHSTIACGGVVRESWGPGTRAATLRTLLVAARRVLPAAS